MTLLVGAASDPTRVGKSLSTVEDKRQRWLNDEFGLRFNPFQHLDAGADPRIAHYLVGHQAFQEIWGDWPTFLFAPAGGGKTAFRARLARACRTGQDGRRIFSVIYSVPRPRDPLTPAPDEEYFEALLNYMALSLLLRLVYRPHHFLDLNPSVKEQVRSVLEHNLPTPLSYYLAQLEESGSLAPIIRAYDPTAFDLPGKPLAERILSFCRAMRETAFNADEENYPTDPFTRFDQFKQLLKQILAYEAIYILVDGVDAHVQTPSAVVSLLDPVLARLREWQSQSIFMKFFLPEELHPLLKESYPKVLTAPSRVIIIKWEAQSLVEVIRERLRVASGGMFSSLKAISTPDIENQVELRLAELVYPTLPREVIHLVHRIFYEHMKRVGPYGRLEQRDIDAAFKWYQSH